MKYKVAKDIPQEIFRAYDIRGIVDESFTENNIYTIGLALGGIALDKKITQVAVGRDGRLSGPLLLEALIAGIVASGCNVINIGEVTTPILYYQAALLESKSGVMLSGSHNPPNYNGIKMVLGGDALYGEEIDAIYQRIVAGNFKYGTGSVEMVSIIDNYLSRVTEDIKLARKLKLVIDCGNGVGGKVAPMLFRKLGCEVVELYCEVDGSFPHHQPDPSEPKNMVDLVAAVKRYQADVGVAFDGDADRIGVVTDQGGIVVADRLLMLLALDLLTRYQGETIIFDVKCGRNLADQITKHGGVPMMYKTGHSLIKAKMKELGVMLAGEMSGHIFMKERWLGFDDGIYVAARFLEILANQDKSCDELFATLPDNISTPELKVAISEDKKFAFMERLKVESKFPGGRINLIDGIRVDYPDGFGLVRPSNTSPYLVMRFEGDTQESLQRIQNIFKAELLKLDGALVV